MTRTSLGSGRLNWPSSERRSDRYGLVSLFDRADELLPLKHLPPQQGKLIAVVRETRVSDHIGDLFRGIFPSTPDVGEEITLGEGELFYQDDYVGLRPSDDRESDWLDPNKLYRAHAQTVDLLFEAVS